MFQNTKQVILKVTRGCNISCAYCYVFNKDDFRGEVISEETYTDLLERFFSETLYGNPNIEGEFAQNCEIVFHGGEPLTIGKKRFEKLLQIGYQIAKKYNKNLTLALQTNGLMIDDEWMAIFKRYQCNPGLSFDGFGTSDAERKTGEKLLNVMLDLKTKGLANGVLIVLHQNNIKNLIKDIKILLSIGIYSFKINRAVDVTTNKPDSDFELTGPQLLSISKEICYLLWNNPNFSESNMEMAMNNFLVGETQDINPDVRYAHCGARFCGAGKTLIEVEPDGTIQFCGRNSRTNDLTKTGHFKDNDVLELQGIVEMWKFHSCKIDSVISNECNLCPAQSICDGDCIAFQFQKTGYPSINQRITCPFYKGLYEFFLLHKKEIIEYLKNKKGIKYESNPNINM